MFELRPFDHRNNRAMRTYDPFREMEEMERAFFGRPFGGERGFSALTEFKTDIQDKATAICWRPISRASRRRTSTSTSTATP